MFKMQAEFEDFLGTKRKELHYFHLSESEIAMMDLVANNSLQARFKFISESNDGGIIAPAFLDIMEKAYGVISEDGLHFRKSPEIWADFKNTGAFNDIFLRILSDTDLMVAFSNGIVPKDLDKTVANLPQNQSHQAEPDVIQQDAQRLGRHSEASPIPYQQ